jgi:uncharacterized protein
MTTTAQPPAQQPMLSSRKPSHVRGSRVAAAVVAAVGVVLTSIGGGVCLRFLTKTGMSGTAALSGLVLIFGLASLALAGVFWWRKAQRWQRLWFFPGVLVALLVMWSLAQGAMLAYAPRTGLGAVTPADRGLAYTDVTFRASDGAQLSAWYIPSANHAAMVTVPGSGSNRVATLSQAVVLARHGYGVLMMDPRGQGRSGGRAMDAGWYGESDITGAVTFLQKQAGISSTKIGVLGLSMGGEEAIGASGVDPRIRAVVAEGATHRTAADKAGYLPGGAAGAVQRGLDWLTYGTAALLSPAPEPGTLRYAIAHIRTTRYLLIAAGKGVDEPDAVAHLRSAAPNRVQTWIVPGATHTHGLATSPTQWEQHVTGFLDEVLG